LVIHVFASQASSCSFERRHQRKSDGGFFVDLIDPGCRSPVTFFRLPHLMPALRNHGEQSIDNSTKRRCVHEKYVCKTAVHRMLFGALAFAQSGDAMKHDDMKNDQMNHDRMKDDQKKSGDSMKKDDMAKDSSKKQKKSKKAKKDAMQKDEMKHDDSMKH
jgi:pentapeptide MXKDX repeat protein